MRFRLFSRWSGWLLTLVFVGGGLGWNGVERAARLRQMTAVGAAADHAAPPPGARRLLLPEASPAGLEWVAQAEAARTQHAWRVRRVDYDNAPFGRETHLASPYRWWLELVAHGQATARSGGISPVEQAVLASGPWLQLLLLAGAGLVVLRSVGPAPAMAVMLGGAALFPFASSFVPGWPDDAGWRAGGVLLSLLPLLLGLRSATPLAAPRTRWWFLASGVVGGGGLWASAATPVPVLAGVLLGGLAGSLWSRRGASGAVLPWRLWAWSGAAVSVAGYLWEYAPGGLWRLRLEANHPLFALAWLGAAEVLVRAEAGWPRGTRAEARRAWGLLGGAALAVVGVAAALALSPGRMFPGAAGNLEQLSPLAGGIFAGSLGEWLTRDGLGVAAWATLAPLLLVPVGFARLWRLRNEPAARERLALCVGLGPVLGLLVPGVFQLHWWVPLDAALLALLAVMVPANPSPRQWAGWGGAVLAVVLPGAWLLRVADSADEASPAEVEALVARDLAHWLARRAGAPGAVVLAPPGLTAALIHYGGLRGVGTPAWENQEGFTGVVRTMSSASMDEAQALVRRRGVRFLVLPSWDSALRDYARLGADEFAHTLGGQLDRWLPPRWLRPVPYQLPGIAGLEGRDVGVFEVVEPADNSTALSRLAEYFLETNRAGLAESVAAALKQSFAQDPEAWIARGQVAVARRDAGELRAVLGPLEAALAQGRVRTLPWDRQVSLALLLAQVRGPAAARPLAADLLAEADGARWRALTPGTLYGFLRFNRAVQLAPADPAVQAQALELLPPEWRAALGAAPPQGDAHD